MTRQREIELGLAQVVGQILRRPGQQFSIDVLARDSGYDRSHWSRLFRYSVGETPGTFMRRIRLEMAAHLLTRTSTRIEEIAEQCGYQNPSAFTRAFRREVGSTPESFRQKGPEASTKFGAKHGIHWNPLWDMDQIPAGFDRRFPFALSIRPAVRLAAIERYGNYSHIGDRYLELSKAIRTLGDDFASRRFFTLYWDNLWTHPTSDGMRAHFGFELRPSESPPRGFTLYTLPGGRFVTISRSVRRDERNDAWSWMTRQWSGTELSFDEHAGLPIPWNESLTKLWCKLGDAVSTNRNLLNQREAMTEQR